MHLKGKLVRSFECLSIGLEELISWFEGQNYLNFRIYSTVGITCICESWDKLWVQKTFLYFGLFRVLSFNGSHIFQSMRWEVLDGMITIKTEIKGYKSDSVTVEIWENHCIDQTLLFVVLSLNISSEISDHLWKLFGRDSLFGIGSSPCMRLSLNTIYNNFEK
jgi:hypothetical protein